jgi:peptidoglycan/xylan/chitin deacetylase (PgdA/CDA1 family)
MCEAYLTIDDSPSPHTKAMTDFLVERGVPALLFCRGDMIAECGRESLIYAVQHGLVLGNHAYHHYRASEQPFDVIAKDIMDTEALIDQVYAEAGVARGARYFRFPHIDRGAGGWIIDYDRLSPQGRDDVIAVFADGLNINLTPPTPAQLEQKRKLQDFLKDQGFSPFPAGRINFSWYRDTELATAIDVPYTYSLADWMLLDRHKGKWPYATIEDLKTKIDDDKWLSQDGSCHIFLAHDKDQIEIVLRDLVDHCLNREIGFLPIPE